MLSTSWKAQGYRRRFRWAMVASILLHSGLILGWIHFLSTGSTHKKTAHQQAVLEASREFDLQWPGKQEESSDAFPQTIQMVQSPLVPIKVDQGHSTTTSGHDSKAANAPKKKKPAFFGVPIQATRIVYVIDRSLSMGLSRSLDRARNALLDSLFSMPEDSHFQVVIYNQKARLLSLGGDVSLLPLAPIRIQKTEQLLAPLLGEGGTDHVQAMKLALSFRPEVVFLVTDAQDLTGEEVQQITRYNRRLENSVIYTIDLSTTQKSTSTLERLAKENGGTLMKR